MTETWILPTELQQSTGDVDEDKNITSKVFINLRDNIGGIFYGIRKINTKRM